MRACWEVVSCGGARPWNSSPRVIPVARGTSTGRRRVALARTADPRPSAPTPDPPEGSLDRSREPSGLTAAGVAGRSRLWPGRRGPPARRACHDAHWPVIDSKGIVYLLDRLKLLEASRPEER